MDFKFLQNNLSFYLLHKLTHISREHYIWASYRNTDCFLHGGTRLSKLIDEKARTIFLILIRLLYDQWPSKLNILHIKAGTTGSLYATSLQTFL